MEVGKKIKRLRKERKITQRELANKLNIAVSTVSSWELGTNKPLMDKIQMMAALFNVKPSYFLDDEVVSVVRENSISYDAFRMVPLLGKVTAGEPITAIENKEGSIPVSEMFLDRSKEYFYLKVKGDSMNLEFSDGSFVLVEHTSVIENGQIAVVLIDNEEATVKKVMLNDNNIALLPQSTNNTHQPKLYNLAKDNVQIIGKVVQAMKMY